MNPIINLKSIFSLIIIISCVFRAEANDHSKLTLSDSVDYYKLDSIVEYLEDETEGFTYTLDDILTDSISNKFNKKLLLTDSLKSRVMWARFKIVDNSENKRSWWLETRNVYQASVTLYYYEEGKYKFKSIGYSEEKVRIKQLIEDEIYFTSTMDTSYCYVRVSYRSNGALPYFELSPAYQTIQNYVQKQYANYLFIGALLIMAIYHLILFLSIRERSYVYYVLYLISFASFMIGRVDEYPYKEYVVGLSGVGIATFYLLFGKSFLDLKNTLPKWDKIVSSILGLFLITTVAIATIDNEVVVSILAVLLPLTSFSIFLIILFPAVILWRKGISSAKYIVIGNIALFAIAIGGGILMIYLYHDHMGNSLRMGGIAELIVFSIGLGAKYRELGKEKELAQEKALIHLEGMVEERTFELKKQRDIAENQREAIEEAHKEITDSINYAERIQRSFLATNELLDENLNEYFVYFNPKEAVSGDFYWAGKLSNGTFAMVNADSTGHGVPGAIMSILNISSIEEAVKEGSTAPNDIFNKARKFIIERLKKDGSEHGGKDGMDASLISFNSDKTKMTYVTAQNPIWIIRDGKLTEIKPEKMPVGKHDNDHIPFNGGEYDTLKGDQIYTLTDGFQDQFGGPRGKKFMVKKMREYVLSISNLTMAEQHQNISEVFSNWKGDIEQVDDVCVIGIRI